MYTFEYPICTPRPRVTIHYHPPCNASPFFVGEIFDAGTSDARIVFAPNLATAGILPNMMRAVLDWMDRFE